MAQHAQHALWHSLSSDAGCRGAAPACVYRRWPHATAQHDLLDVMAWLGSSTGCRGGASPELAAGSPRNRSAQPTEYVGMTEQDFRVQADRTEELAADGPVLTR